VVLESSDKFFKREVLCLATTKVVFKCSAFEHRGESGSRAFRGQSCLPAVLYKDTKLKTKAVSDYATILVCISVYLGEYRQLAAVLLRVGVPVSVLRQLLY
jgi:hypothetical protein